MVKPQERKAAIVARRARLAAREGGEADVTDQA